MLASTLWALTALAAPATSGACEARTSAEGATFVACELVQACYHLRAGEVLATSADSKEDCLARAGARPASGAPSVTIARVTADIFVLTLSSGGASSSLQVGPPPAKVPGAAPTGE